MDALIDPLEGLSIAEYGSKLRRRQTSAKATVEAYLQRIEMFDGKIGAYEHVAADLALGAADSIDRLLAAGVDLGPLMGVPIAVKDLLAVDGMPTRAGSDLDVADIIGGEGSFIRRLKRAGCIVLGKAKTVEFALGAVGINAVRGTPWNPSDPNVARIPGGSSSGPAVAVAARLCAFAIGSDTGGSVRLPAALCGTFGLKTTVGLWPLDGVFPLSPTFDSLGILSRTAEDASTVFFALSDVGEPPPADIAGLRFGKPVRHFFDGLDDAVASCTEAALQRLRAAGARVVEIDVPEAAERSNFFPIILPAELISALGRERFDAGRSRMDPVVATRAASGLEVAADHYIRLLRRQRELVGIAQGRMAGLDAWITPSATIQPVPVSDFDNLESGLALAFSITQNSQPMNLFGQCGASLPIHHLGADYPVGLQIACSPHQDAKVLGIARAIENVLGSPPAPDLAGVLVDSA
jgi:aspartyl-tRNA(Asn)/glutamyl-tRNA(Gln) amidotransferase subunit A